MVMTVILAGLSASMAQAEEDKMMRSAATILALAMQTDDELIVESETHAHLANYPANFEKIGACTYAERIKSLGGDRFLIVNFNKLTGHFGYTHGEIALPGLNGETQASCFRYDSLGVRCSGALHMPRGIDENLMMTSLDYLQQHGCGGAAF
jgi:hypothetical protein